jgi:hypothetical protein
MAERPDLTQFRRGGIAPEKLASSARPDASPDSGLQRYEAFQLGREEKRALEIRLKFPEPAETPSNALLKNIIAEWRFGTSITLSYLNDMVIAIQGANLTELYRALKEWKVEFIQEFDSQVHEPVADKNAPFIASITIHTTRPEEPPLDARH